MSRRVYDTEPAFGSDSFMDVIANIVGILIILVVIAGLRVSQHVKIERQNQANAAANALAQIPPVEPEEEPAEEPPPTPPVVVEKKPKPSRLPPQPLAEPLEPLPAMEVPEELVAKVARLRQELIALEATGQKVVQQQQQIQQRKDQLVGQLRSTREIAQEKRTETAAAEEYVLQERRDLEAAKKQLQELLKQLKEAEAKLPPSKQIEHRITPVSRVVNGGEKHFRVANNRVSEVPVEELVSQVKSQLERRKELIAKSRVYQGQAGPLKGFNMKYQVQRENASVSDEIRYGQGVFKITVTQWEIQPESNLVAETAGEALRPGSRFYQSLIDTDQDVAITFWVYPDSFATFRQLQAHAHSQGFIVAARPLPNGFPIAGSPAGTKSAGQ